MTRIPRLTSGKGPAGNRAGDAADGGAWVAVMEGCVQGRGTCSSAGVEGGFDEQRRSEAKKRAFDTAGSVPSKPNKADKKNLQTAWNRDLRMPLSRRHVPIIGLNGRN